MEKLLRNCYAEAGLKGANAVIFQKRSNVIRTIVDERLLEENEWEGLTEWVLDIKNNEVDDILIKLEENFCKEDENFSKENIKELKVLGTVLVYQYSKEYGIFRFPLMIICRCHAGYMLLSKSLYLLFVQYIDEMRLAMRHTKEVDKKDCNLGAAKLKKTIVEAKKKLEEEEKIFSYSSVQFDSIVDILCQCELVLQNQMKREQYLVDELKAQKEESNMAWWLLNEWSNIYVCPLSELSPEKAALTVPIELWELNEYVIGAYTIKQLIFKGMSFLKEHSNTISLDDLIESVGEDIYRLINIEDIQAEQIQPILMALKCAYECRNNSDDKAWRIVFEAKCQRKAEEVKLDAKEMAYQLYLELELAYLEE